jgi:prophage DNA circulation protein
VADPLDVLGNLLPAKLRGIEAPCLTNSAEVSQNLVEHNQYGVAGGEQENTCRKSARFSFKFVFRGGIAGYRNLYPKTFREFWNACCDPTTAPFQHPEFGLIDVKVASFNIAYDPTRRDGVDLDVVLLETIEKGLSIELTAASPITYAVGLAGDLETMSADVEVPPYEDGSGLTLKEALSKIKGTIALAGMSVSNLLSDIENSIGAINGMLDMLNTTTDVKSWQAIDTLKKIEAALQQTEQKAATLVKNKTIEIKNVAVAGLPSVVAAQFGLSIEDFYKLNPMMAIYDTIPVGTQIFTYS